MQGLSDSDLDFSFKQLFVPLTTAKAITLIIIIGLIVYFNSLFGAFIGDDFGQIVNNNFIHSINGIFIGFLGGSFYAAGQLIGTYYKPIQTMLYTLLYITFGPVPFFFHLFQLSIHISNSILLYLIGKRFFTNKISFIIALVFLIHPINVESVVYIADLQDVLFLFFGLLSLYVTMTVKENKKLYWLVYLFLFCSLLSKETGILFFFIIPLYITLFKKNLLILKHIFILFCIIVLYLFLRFEVAHIALSTSSIVPIGTASLQTRLINIPLIISYYINNFFFPNKLLASQSWIINLITFSTFYVPLIEIVFLGILLLLMGVWIFKKHKEQFSAYIFFISWFIFGLFLHIQLFPLDQTVADRWFYFPIIGILGVIGVFLANINVKKNYLNTVIYTLLTVVILLLSFRTVGRISNWKNGLTLLGHDIQFSNNDFLMESTYGGDLLIAGQDKQALYHLQRAVKIYPHYGITWYNLGTVYVKLGKITKAKEAFSNSIKYGHYFGAYEQLAILFYKYNDPETARKFIENARLYYPKDIQLLALLIIVQYKTGDHQGALNSAEQLYYLDPSSGTYAIYTTCQVPLLGNS